MTYENESCGVVRRTMWRKREKERKREREESGEWRVESGESARDTGEKRRHRPSSVSFCEELLRPGRRSGQREKERKRRKSEAQIETERLDASLTCLAVRAFELGRTNAELAWLRAA